MSATDSNRSVRRIAPLGVGVPWPIPEPEIDPEQRDSLERTRDERGAGARRRLIERYSARNHAWLVETNTFLNAQNEQNSHRQEDDLPGCAELVDCMRGDCLPPGLTGAKKRADFLKALKDETARRNHAAHENLLAKLCGGQARAKRMPEADGYQVVSAITTTGGHSDEYRVYKSKVKNASGGAAEFGLLIICYSEACLNEKKMLSMMQRRGFDRHRVSHMILFEAIEVLLKVDFATALLLRLQQKETKEHVDFANAASIVMRERLAEVEDELHHISERGQNKAQQNGASITSFDLQGGLINDSPMEVLNALGACSAALQELLQELGAALRRS